MPRSVQKRDTAVISYLTVYDSANAPVTGLVNVDFTKLLALNGVASAVVATVSEVGSGRYSVTFTPNADGAWYLLVRNATYNPRGWDEEYDVTVDGVLTVSVIGNGILDLPAAIDGYTPREVAKIVGAATGGEGAGTGLRPYMALDKSAARITATTTPDGDRTLVTLTP